MSRKQHASSLRVLATSALLAPMLSVPNTVKAQQVRPDTLADFARQSLSYYTNNAVSEQNVGGLGFDDLRQARAASLGDPLAVTMIALQDLKDYTTDVPLDNIVRDGGAYWFPVVSGNQTRAQLEILRTEGGFVAGDFGKPVTARAIADVQARLPAVLEAGDIDPPYQTTLLRIPALAATLVHVSSSQGDFLVPAMVNPLRYGLENGRVYAATELLQRLHEVAVDIEGDKVM